MATRRSSRCGTKLNINYNNLTVNEVLCPICRSILIEPVSLPCNHVFCSSCFQGTVENANLVCPLCRTRIGSWLRYSKKANKLVNQEYWNAIQKFFPSQVKNKLQGIEDNLEEAVPSPAIKLASPGEIRKEYELFKQKENLLLQKEREAEAKASEELINKLQAEEEYWKSKEKDTLKLDEKIAKKLSQQYNPKCRNSIRKCGPMDKFLKPSTGNMNCSTSKVKVMDFANKEYTCKILCNNQSKACTIVNNGQASTSEKKCGQNHKSKDTVANKIETDEAEYRYFKPVDHKHSPTSDGITAIKVVAKKAAPPVHIEIMAPSGPVLLHSHINESAFARLHAASPVLAALIVPSTSKITDSELKGKRKSNLLPMPQKRPRINGVAKKINGKISPPFCGFESSSAISEEKDTSQSIIKEDSITKDYQPSKATLKMQEQSDYEYAKRLQDELNKLDSYYTRGVQPRRSSRSKKQLTLDNILSPYKVK